MEQVYREEERRRFSQANLKFHFPGIETSALKRNFGPAGFLASCSGRIVSRAPTWRLVRGCFDYYSL